MNIKRTLILMTCGLMVFSSSAYARTSVKTDVDSSNNVSITIKTDRASELTYGVMIMNPDEKLEDNTTDAAISEVFKYSTVKGTGSATLDLGTVEPGRYQVIIGGGELKGEEKYFVVPSGDTWSEAIEALNGAKTPTAVATALSNYNQSAWELDLTDERYTADQDTVLTSVSTLAKEGLDSAGEISEAFEVACALSEIKNSASDEILTNLKFYEEDLGLSYSNAIETNDEKVMTAFTYLAADSEVNPINSPKQLDTVLKRAEALGMVNAATRGTMESTLAAYAETLGIDLEGDYADIDQYEVIKLITKSEDEDGTVKKDYTSIKEFSDAFAEAVLTVAEAEGTPEVETGRPGSSSGGGGGGGGGGRREPLEIAPSYGVDEPGEIVDTKDDGFSATFGDVALSHWAVDYIDYAAFKGFMSGDGDGTFRPEDKITREEFLKVILDLLAIANTDEDFSNYSATKPPYGDVEADDWFYNYVKRGIYAGVINGVSADSFGSGQYLTRQDAAVIILRARDAAKVALTDVSNSAELNGFTDDAAIADYAKEAVTKLQKTGIINGYETGEFRPSAGITRAEVAKMAYSLLNNIGEL